MDSSVAGPNPNIEEGSGWGIQGDWKGKPDEKLFYFYYIKKTPRRRPSPQQYEIALRLGITSVGLTSFFLHFRFYPFFLFFLFSFL